MFSLADAAFPGFSYSGIFVMSKAFECIIFTWMHNIAYLYFYAWRAWGHSFHCKAETLMPHILPQIFFLLLRITGIILMI